MITNKKPEAIKIYSLTSPTIASIAGKIMARSLDVTAREVVTLAASALAQSKAAPQITAKKPMGLAPRGRG